jgi:hypothetical protein
MSQTVHWNLQVLLPSNFCYLTYAYMKLSFLHTFLHFIVVKPIDFDIIEDEVFLSCSL